jgi:hypothetical protein
MFSEAIEEMPKCGASAAFVSVEAGRGIGTGIGKMCLSGSTTGSTVWDTTVAMLS